MPKVLVLDAQMRNSLVIIRSLGEKKFFVAAGEDTRFATGFFSKYCRKIIVYPNPSKFPEKFIGFILDIVKRERYDMVIPVTNSTVIPLVKNRDLFSEYTTIPYPDYNLLIKAIDKELTLKAAIETKVPHPFTYFCDDLEEIDVKSLVFPIILKPRSGFGSHGVTQCNSLEELIRKYPIIKKNYGPLLIQDYIPFGGEIGVYTIFDSNSEPISVTVQKRLRSYPISGGPSTLRKTVDDDNLIEISFQLLRSMKWIGLAMVEFRIDKRDGLPRLMEINPRFWGSLQLSILAGADFPYILYKLMSGGSIHHDLNYKKEVYCRWLLPGDVLWLLNAPKTWKTLKSFIFSSVNDDIISLTDPGPILGFFVATIRYLFDKEMWNFILKKQLK